MKKIKFWAILIGLSLIIPIMGITVSNLVSNGYHKLYLEVLGDRLPGIDSINSKIPEALDIGNFCKDSNLSNTTLDFCNQYFQVKYLNYASIITLFYSIFIILLIPILGRIAAKNRNILFWLFRPGLFFSQISSVILVAANSAILVFSIYFAEPYYFGRLHYGIILGVSIAALIAVISVSIKALSPIKRAEARVFGKILYKNAYPKIWQFIESIAKQTGTTPPDTIIVGLEPTFFVTQTKVICLDGEISGKTLFISLPFCRVLEQDELQSIVGHELGHFVGDDTKWSQKFYPIYRGSIETLATLHTHGGESVAFLPAIYFMSLFIFSFEKAEKEIGRERELNADRLGAKISSPTIMAKALLKAHIYQHAWQFTQDKIKEALNNGKQIINISSFFSSVCELTPSDFMKDEIGKSSTTHPTDTHPPLLTRLDSIGIQLSSVYADSLKIPTSNLAIDLIENSLKLEEELSELEHYKLVKSGVVTINNESSPDNNATNEAPVST